MPTLPPTLSNCYIPLPANKPNIFINPASRPDGSTSSTSRNTCRRNAKTIRRLCIDRHILSSSSGSSLVELGHTKVLCNVHGPRPLTSSSLPSESIISDGGGTSSFHTKGILNCQIRFAPNFGINPRKKVISSPTNLDGFANTTNNSTSSQEIELSSRLKETLLPSIPLYLLQKNVLDVFVMVLQGDGGAFVASVLAASLALADSGIEIYDLVSIFSVAVVPSTLLSTSDGGRAQEHKTDYVTEKMDVEDDEDERGISKVDSNYCLLADPDEEELTLLSLSSSNNKSSKIGGVVTVAMMNSWKEVVYWDQNGRLLPELSQEAVELCRDGCVAMHNFMRKALVGKHTS